MAWLNQDKRHYDSVAGFESNEKSDNLNSNQSSKNFVLTVKSRFSDAYDLIQKGNVTEEEHSLTSDTNDKTSSHTISKNSKNICPNWTDFQNEASPLAGRAGLFLGPCL